MTPERKEVVWGAIVDYTEAKRALEERRRFGEMMNADYHDAVERARDRLDALLDEPKIPVAWCWVYANGKTSPIHHGTGPLTAAVALANLSSHGPVTVRYFYLD